MYPHDLPLLSHPAALLHYIQASTTSFVTVDLSGVIQTVEVLVDPIYHVLP